MSSSNLFDIAETKNFQKIKTNIDKKVYEKIVKNVYPISTRYQKVHNKHLDLDQSF